VKRSTRAAIDRASHALAHLSEKLDLEPNAEEFQAEVDRMLMDLNDQERNLSWQQVPAA
jgi:hypothetical protein